MISKTIKKFSPEVRERAVLMVLDHEEHHVSRRTALAGREKIEEKQLDVDMTP
jgi:transposase-like protein